VVSDFFYLLNPPVSGTNEIRAPAIEELIIVFFHVIIGLAVSVIAGFAFRWHAIKKGRKLVRTF
jgi:hypothetical protein